MAEATAGGGKSSGLGLLMQSRVAARHGAPDASVNFMRAALEAVKWDKRKHVLQLHGYSVYLDEALDVGRFWVSRNTQVIVMSAETWDTLNYDLPTLNAIIEDMTRGSDGMRFIDMTEPRFGAAVRNRAAAHGRDIVTAKDAIDELQDSVNALVLMAQNADMDTRSDAEAQIYVLKFAKAEHEYDVLLRRLLEMRSLMDLAAVAITS